MLNSRGRGYVNWRQSTPLSGHLGIYQSFIVERMAQTYFNCKCQIYIENISILPIVTSNYSSILFNLVVHCNQSAYIHSAFFFLAYAQSLWCVSEQNTCILLLLLFCLVSLNIDPPFLNQRCYCFSVFFLVQCNH